jgi:hypothetical protein
VVALELAVCGGDSATGVAVVDDVVVDESCGVKKFQTCREVYDPILFGVGVGVHRDIAERYGSAPSPIGKASAESLTAMKEGFGNSSKSVGVRRDFWNFTMRPCDNVSKVCGNAIDERCWRTHGSTLAKHALHYY